MLSMGRKRKYSTKEKHKSCTIIEFIKRHGSGITCVNTNDYHFEIKEEVVETLKDYAQHNGNELCGVLTGILIGEKTYRICKVSMPCVKTNSRYGCERDAVLANQFLKEDYNVSEQTRTYIGEWHTHPVSEPRPSGVDYQSIERNFYSAKHSAPFLIMIIVGTEVLHICMYNGERFEVIDPKVV